MLGFELGDFLHGSLDLQAQGLERGQRSAIRGLMHGIEEQGKTDGEGHAIWDSIWVMSVARSW